MFATKSFRLGALVAGAALTVLTLSAPGAGAITVRPGQLIHNPDFCIALYGDPNPCPPPDRPTPIDDPSCLRVDVEPLHCPYLP